MIFTFTLTNVGAAPTVHYQIEVDKQTNKLYLYKNGDLYKVYPVATGRTQSLTPEGTFTLVVKIVKPGWKNIPGGDPNNPLGPRWLGISVNGDKGRSYGIHGTNQPESIGSHASSGCVRMRNEDVIQLYDIVPEGTPVWIHNGQHTGRWEGDPSYGVQPASGQLKITVDKTNIRTGPSTGAFVITRLAKNTVIEKTGVVRDWYQVKLNDGKTGYVYNANVVNAGKDTGMDTIRPASGRVQITASRANVRTAPSLSAPIIQKAVNGTVFSLTGQGREWYEIQLSNGYKAYLHQSVAKKVN
ncbi:L,D-transpeptidase family protein [Polycladomyces subterraneus]|uniref:L,D-transpeptidase family protein n=1 Tax=Polycladomyces subterraneus TaxID=1016997 RepID=A0ABT8IMF0_9BACL|nr:L,D-transpeptidase family protein [Polycladomyces subterraneus]MDN4593716.1 L,D-transpeptidase family protein [Polycladomyces subterraneus]